MIREHLDEADPALGVATPSDVTTSALVGGMWSSANIALPYLLTLAVSIVAARVLGPDEMGRQSFIAFVTLIATAVCAAGLPLALTRSAGEALGRGDPGALRGLVRAAWLVELPLSVVGLATLLIVAALGAEPRTAWLLASVTVLAGALGGIPLAALSGALEWKGLSLAILSTSVASTALTLAALALGFGVTGIIAVRLVQTATVALWSTVLLRSVLRRNASTRPTEPKLEKAMLRYAAGSSVSVLLTLVVYQRSEVFFLNHFSTDAEIAHYAIASSGVTILLAAPQALGVALAPTLSRLHGAGQLDRVRAGYSKALRMSMLGAIPTLGLAAIMGPTVLLLVYGESYRGIGKVFVVLLPSLIAVPLISSSAAVLVAHRRLRSPLVALAAAAAANLLVAYELVPRYGAAGAAAASVAALGVAASLQVMFALRVVHTVDLDPRHLSRLALASGAATAVGLGILEVLPSPLEIFVAPTAFVLVFGGTAAVVGVASAEDARWLVDLAGRAHPRAAAIIEHLIHP